jgi:hypothetical protein
MTVTANSGISPQRPKLGLATIVNADGTALKTVITAGADGSKVTSLMLSSNDTTARDIQWGVSRSGTFYPRGTINVPITGGTIAATTGVDAFSFTACPGLPLDSDGQPYIFLESGDTLDVKTLVAVTAAKTIYAASAYGNF